MRVHEYIYDRFYYDFFLPNGSTFSDADLLRIKKEMDCIIKQNLSFRREEVTVEEARYKDTTYSIVFL